MIIYQIQEPVFPGSLVLQYFYIVVLVQPQKQLKLDFFLCSGKMIPADLERRILEAKQKVIHTAII